MTGYGRAKLELPHMDIVAEIRSVNHRYLDVTVKAPRVYGFLDEPVKAETGKAVARGKVEIFFTMDTSKKGTAAVFLNRSILEGYLTAFDTLEKEYGFKKDLSVMDAARLPDVLGAEKTEEDAEQLTKDVLTVFSEALRGFNEMRDREGGRLKDDVAARLVAIERLVGEIEERSPQSVTEYREKLTARMEELLNGAFEPQRILTEAAVFADKVAVDEELVRLKSHVHQVRKLMDERAAMGRKLDFIVQEMNREANTIGSKCNDFEISSRVIDLKAEIEKIREQVQNIE